MQSEILYMLTIIGVVFAVNYALRALPFLLVIGRDRALPPWVERAGKFISPIIIAGLVVYSFSCLNWRSSGPFVAALVTVALHLWKRNSLASIIAGTALYMCLLNCGCATVPAIDLDVRNPSIEVRSTGVYVANRLVAIEEVPALLEDAGVTTDTTVHILVDEKAVRDLGEARSLMGCLALNGYTRPILVTKRHADSWVKERR